MQPQNSHSPRPLLGWMQLAAALAAGLALRLYFIHFYGETAGDTLLYGDIAKNLLQHGIFGLTHDAGPTPTIIRLPGYPLFLAACFRLFGTEHYNAVMYVQCVADLLACAVAGATAARLWGRKAGLSTLWIAALCPFTANYVATPLTEALTIFCTVAALYALVRWRTAAMDKPLEMDLWFWMMAVALACSLLLRPDNGLLMAALIPAAVWIAWTHHDPTNNRPAVRAHAVEMAVVLCIAVLLPLVPWTCRNWRTFHEIQPLAPRYATDPGELVGYGFNRWYRTWAMEYKSTEDIYWNLNDETMDINTIPTRAFDSDAQYEATRQLLDEYNDTTTETPEMDARFDAIAQQRIAANPLRYYVELPTARVIDMWLRPRTERLPLDTEWWNYGEHPLESILIAGYALLNLAYLLAAGIGAWKAWRWLSSEQRPILWAMLGFVALRTALLFTLDNAEQRYTLECFPMIFLLGGYALSCAWRRQSN